MTKQRRRVDQWVTRVDGKALRVGKWKLGDSYRMDDFGNRIGPPHLDGPLENGDTI